MCIRDRATGMCFVAGTEVHTEEGKERIEEIEAGDRVWAEDPETGEKGIKTVVSTFERETDELVLSLIHISKRERTERADRAIT